MHVYIRLRDVTENALVVPVLSACAALIIRTRRPLVIGITGSVGKTTTKETVAGVLMHARDTVGVVHKTPGNMNNNLGVAMTVLGYERWFETARGWLTHLLLLPFRTFALATLAPYPDVLVLEIAAGLHGSVPGNCRIVRPTIGVVTEIGPAHLEHFGSVEEVIREKSAMVRAIPPSGLVVLNGSNPLVLAMAAVSRAPVVEVEGRGIELARNVARAIARHLGVPDTAIETALGDLKPVPNRLQRITAGEITIIDDSISANPLSMKLALDELASSASPGQRRVAILGTMRELGGDTVRYHEEIGAYARARADLLIGVGEHVTHYQVQRSFADSHGCAAAIGSIVQAGDAVLIKGSAAVKLGIVVEALRDSASLSAIK